MANTTATMQNSFGTINENSANNINEDVEYYPRHKRAPYLHDISDFGIRPSSQGQHGEGDEGDLVNDDGDGGMMVSAAAGGGPQVPKSASSSSLSQPSTRAIRRRSSFARVFSSLGMGPSPIVEDGAGETTGSTTAANNNAAWGGPDESGGATTLHFEDSETNPTSLLPPRFRRGSSAEFMQQRQMSMESVGGMVSTRDRLGNTGNVVGNTTGGATMNRIPRWALHDQSAIVMKDGLPIPMGTLLHHHSLLNQPNSSPNFIVTPTWRVKDRMRTVGVCLVLALNIGTDPPDLNKPTPCAKLQCWLDPTSISRAKAKERIGERLEQQYAKWQQRSKLKYRRALDPTVDMVKELCLRMRESAKQERVLLHYNGHGVPRPTANGEIWLFDKHHTNYIPLSVTDLRRWIGKPSIVVLDCSGAGVLLPFFTAALNHDATNAGPGGVPYNRLSSNSMVDNSDDVYSGAEYLKAIRDTIVLCPTAQGEWLPLNPEFPADIFTACLTTPIPIALRWFVHQTPLSTQGLDLDTIFDAFPGKLTDRKTPLGELNWIFTAITDTIAFNVLPSPLFQRLFRQDLMVASMFRNFLLADRILRSLDCSPRSHPELPSTCHHPLWQAWDLAVETCLTQLIDSGVLKKGSEGSLGGVPVSPVEGEETVDATQRSGNEPPTRPFTASTSEGEIRKVANPSAVAPDINAPFFAEQLTAFEIWLEWASSKPRNRLVIRCPPSAVGGTPLPFLQGRQDAEKAQYELDPPQELPIVLQVLLSQAHRVRALVLLRRFLDLGPSAVNLALSVGIFPYVLKLLQSPIDEYKHVLIGIWAKVMGFDPSCKDEVVKDRPLPHFIRHLRWGMPPSPTSASSLEDAAEQRTMAAFILSVICNEYPVGQSECINEKLHTACGSLLQSLESLDESEQKEAEKNMTPQFRMWLIICLGNLAKDNTEVQSELYKVGLHWRLLARLEDDAPDVRTATCYALGSLIGAAPVKSNAIEAPPALPSMLQHQLQPQLQQQQIMQPQLAGAPQSLPPSFRQGAGLVPGALPGPILGPKIGMNVNLSTPSPLGIQSQLRAHQGASIPGVPIPGPGGPNLMSGKQQPMMFSNILTASVPSTQAPPQPEPKSIYEDDERMDLDLSVAIKLAKVTLDASPVVRFEAVLALNRFIGKYLDAFVSIAGNNLGGQVQARSIIGGSMPSIAMPEGVGHEVEKKLAEMWTAVLKLHRIDGFPSIHELVNSIVCAINRRAMLKKTKLRQTQVDNRRRSIGGSIGSIDEKGGVGGLLAGRRNATGLNLSSYDSREQNSHLNLKRVVSAGANAFTIGTPPKILGSSRGSSSPRKGYNQSWQTFPQIDTTPAEEYFFPESKVYFWQKVAFGENEKVHELDPLSDKGAMDRYRKTRNSLARQKGQLLKDTFAVLAERPVMSRSAYGYDESDAAAGIEKEADQKKQTLHLEQVALFRNSGARSTTLLRFHPFEPALVVCGGSDNISVFNAETSERMVAFSNQNPKNTRMTSALWINEASTSLLLTGSNDGTVRVFDGLFEANDEISREKPSLISSFVAAPDIVTDKRYSSGLVLEFQQCGGQLIAGGNTKKIRCWDVATEKCRNTFGSKSDASLTTLTTAWDYDFNNGYSGLGPDIVVAGYGNGSLRVFDTRSNKGDPVLYIREGINRHGMPSRRRKYSEFDEHTSWIVDVSFTTYGGRHEIVSGCVAGSIKFWDLRYSSSVRTIDHKNEMQMTALAAHSNVPMFATGSPAQFIKIMSHDGMTQQVIRYHDIRHNESQRIGPVSCLSFHPHMPFLAAGFADEIVSVYAPKRSVM